MAKREMQLALTFRSHGGKREGAGRPAAKRTGGHHVRRPKLPKRPTAHITLRMQRDVPSLRSRHFIRDFQSRMSGGCERGEFRVCQFSIQRDHVHLVVESAGKEGLGRGMKSVGIRIARAVNRVFGRTGAVLFGRYHLRVLRTPREVRNALAYVLLNTRKHWKKRNGSAPPVVLDVASSGAWFDGWKRPPPEAEPMGSRPVAPARCWLLRRGWRTYGLLDPVEVPGGE